MPVSLTGSYLSFKSQIKSPPQEAFLNIPGTVSSCLYRPFSQHLLYCLSTSIPSTSLFQGISSLIHLCKSGILAQCLARSKSNSYHLLSVHSVLGTIQTTSYILYHVLFTTTLQNKYFYRLRFIDVESEAQRGEATCQSHTVNHGRAGVWTLSVRLQSSHSSPLHSAELLRWMMECMNEQLNDSHVGISRNPTSSSTHSSSLVPISSFYPPCYLHQQDCPVGVKQPLVLEPLAWHRD